MPGTASLREQLRLLRELGDAGFLLQVLPRSAAQGARQDGLEPNPSHLLLRDPFAVRLRFPVFSGDGCCGGGTGGGGRGGDAGEQVQPVQEARGSHGVQLQVRDGVLRRPPVPGAAQLRVRFQEHGERTDRQGQSGRQGGEAPQDLTDVSKRVKKMI
ncbi:unnamed protein product [Linum tenue]|uniref:Uncharacterized protein n=1 Tax=Linum tenue TaxID=586396 RepID=A0AAV0QJ89_9ROSI|nr:unnamed protein product [Linum tenue]